MAIMVQISADGVTKEIYEQLRKEVNWEGNPPPGGMFHASGFGSTGARVVDIWSSEQEFNNFIKTRLMPALQKRNISQPQAEIIQIHNINIFPGLERYKVAQTH
jgi:hypothetical protein